MLLFRLIVPLLVALLLCAAPILAAPPAVPDDENYVAATRHLKAGRWFERAATQLEKAVAAAPNDYRVHLALGCAFANRAAAISYAATFTLTLSVEQTGYPERLADWEKAQKDPDSDEYGDPKPEPPPARLVFRTKDDDKPFTLTTAQAAARIKELSRRARAEWTMALACAQTPAERAHVLHTQGWGLRILKGHATISDFNAGSGDEEEEPDEDAPAPPPAPVDPDVPTDEEILAAFTAATKEAPDEAAYWQSLGDVLKDEKASSAAYRKSLDLSPRDANLLYRLFARAVGKVPYGAGPDNPALRADLDIALDYLRRAAAADAGNAHADYLLTYFRFKETRYGMILGGPREKRDQEVTALQTASGPGRETARRALGFMEAGNRKKWYETPIYRPAVPPLLRAAWNYNAVMDIRFPDFARLRELARAASGYALVAGQSKNIADGERACRSVVAMGMKLVADWPMDDKTKGGGEVLTSLVGRAIAAIGYSTRVQMYQRAGDERGAARAQADYDAFVKLRQAHSDALKPLFERTMYDEY